MHKGRHYTGLSMLEFLTGRADPRRVALRASGGEEIRYADLRAAVRRAAGDLAAHAGARPGSVIAVGVREPVPALVATLAVLESGAAVLPLDMRAGQGGIAVAESRARPVARVVGAGLDGALQWVDGGCELRELAPEAGLLLFTSGSSGMPKGVVLGRTGLMANVDAILTYLPVPAFPRTACVLPLSYSYALVGQAFVTLRAGGTFLALADVPFPARQIEIMAAGGALGLSSVPTSLRLLAEAALEFEPGERPDLGYLASAGAPLDRGTIALIRQAFPGAGLFAQYGLTEASPRVTAIASTEAPFSQGSVGRPLPGIAVRAIGEDGRTLAPGEVGELVVEGPSVMLGYLDDPDGTAEVLGPGWLRTGDFGRVDPEGYVYVEGRRDSIVKCAGERVSLDEVTAVIRKVPGLRDACVLAVPDERTGVRLVAFLERSEVAEGSEAAERSEGSEAAERAEGAEGAERAEGAEAAERADAADLVLTRSVQEAIRTHLPPAKRPYRIFLVARFPRSPNGKLDRPALLKLANARGENEAVS